MNQLVRESTARIRRASGPTDGGVAIVMYSAVKLWLHLHERELRTRSHNWGNWDAINTHGTTNTCFCSYPERNKRASQLSAGGICWSVAARDIRLSPAPSPFTVGVFTCRHFEWIQSDHRFLRVLFHPCVRYVCSELNFGTDVRCKWTWA